MDCQQERSRGCCGEVAVRGSSPVVNKVAVIAKK